MANININRSVNDPFYRYKMPRIVAKVEGKGNGIKTVVSNMVEIAKALGRPPTYPTKYFGCELGAQTNFDLKNERYIVNGEHDANKLQDILDGFIKKFVLCPACDNPETTFKIKGKTINSKCKACGHAFVIDPKHKLSTFILKNPPKDDDSGDEKEKVKENGNGSPKEETNGMTNGFDFAVETMNGTNGHEDDWAEDTDEDKKGLSGAMGKLVLDADLEKSEEERYHMFLKFLQVAKKNDELESASGTKKLLNEAERLEMKEKAPIAVVEAIFDTEVLKQIKQYRTLLLRFCLNDPKAQKYLLHGLEVLIDKHQDTLLPKAAHIIKKLYDEDICTEDVILSWGAKPSKRYVDKEMAKKIRENCAPVLKWLEEAEEDSEESEAEDDDEVAFDDRARQFGTVVEKNKMVNGEKKSATNGPVKGLEDDADEDLDIDAI